MVSAALLFHDVRTLILEDKGDPDEKDDAKVTAARRWVEAVNTWGGLGVWKHHVCYRPEDLAGDLEAIHSQAIEGSGGRTSRLTE